MVLKYKSQDIVVLSDCQALDFKKIKSMDPGFETIQRGNHVLTVREYYEKSIVKLRKIRFITTIIYLYSEATVKITVERLAVSH